MSTKTLSLDLRERVIAAIAGGMSRRQTAARFGVSASSAIRWCAQAETTGSAEAKPRGGDRNSARIEAQAPLILRIVAETCDITLKELQARLAEQGHCFGVSTLWRFFERHGVTYKKRPRTPASRSGRTS